MVRWLQSWPSIAWAFAQILYNTVPYYFCIFLDSDNVFCDARHQGLRASSVSLPSSHCKLCLLVFRMQMHFKATRVTEKRGEAAEGGKRRVSLTKRDEDAGLV